MPFIPRDYTRTERDDFILNVSSRIDDRYTEAVEVKSGEGELVGWEIVARYE